MCADTTYDDQQNPSPGDPLSEEDKELGGAMTFLEHLQELRTRIIYSLYALAIGMVVAFVFAQPITEFLWLSIPEEVETFNRTPIQGVMVYLKVGFVVGFFLAFPFIFYQIWSFVAPGLYRKEKKFLLPLCLSSWSCFLIGASFAYFVVFRFTLDFLITFEIGEAIQMWDVEAYLNFLLRFILAFGVVFQEPVIILLLAQLELVDSRQLAKFRPYAFVLAFALGALITPPDLVSQLMCGFPLILLYELSIWLVKITERKRAREA